MSLAGISVVIMVQGDLQVDPGLVQIHLGCTLIAVSPEAAVIEDQDGTFVIFYFLHGDDAAEQAVGILQEGVAGQEGEDGGAS